MYIKALIFDFGGVLMRTDDLGPRRKWEARFGMKDGELADLVFGNAVSARAALGQAQPAEVWDFVAEQFKLSEGELAELQRDFWAGDRLDTSLTGYVAARRGKYKTAILSNAWPSARTSFERFPELAQAFETWIISAEEGVAKPDPDIYRRALTCLGVDAHEAVFVDDFSENTAAAQALGMHAIHYRSGMDVPAVLAELGIR